MNEKTIDFMTENDLLCTSIKEYVLERFILQKNLRISLKDFKPEMQVHFRHDYGDMIMSLIMVLLGKKQDNEVHIQTPKTWQDMFKKKHQNKWWMKRYLKKHPINYKQYVYDLTKCTIFPTLDLPPFLMDKQQFVYHYHEFKGER